MKNPSEHIVRDLSHTFEMTNDVILTIARRKNLYPSDNEASLSKRARKIFLALARNDMTVFLKGNISRNSDRKGGMT